MQLNNPKSCKAKRDNRFWSLYNESLVKWMENLLDLRAIENIREDLAKQSRHKVGRPFRILESLLRKISDLFGIPKITYSAIYLRIRKINVPKMCSPSASVAIDSTGLKTTIRVTLWTSGERRGKDGSSYMLPSELIRYKHRKLQSHLRISMILRYYPCL